MKPKLLLFLTWLFFIMERRTADEIWLICMAFSAVLTLCAFFYRRENNNTPAGSQGKRA